VGTVAAIAVTGHLDLGEGTAGAVRAELRELLRAHAAAGDLVGLSCLAPGADTIFAEELLAAGGELVAVLPARGWREPGEAFARLLRAAVEVVEMPFDTPDFEGYAAANEVLLARSDLLVAVWDGAPPQGPGGTGDLVRRARDVGRPVVRVWPQGASRGEPGDP
jgi:hypothetical protein